MFGKKKKDSTTVRKVDKTFITYDGYVDGLDMFKKGDKFHRIYELSLPEYSDDFVKEILDDYTQLLFKGNKAYVIYSVKASIPEEALEKFTTIEEGKPLRLLPILEWFSLMAGFTGVEAPEALAAGKKANTMELIQPYNIKNSQTSIEMSDRIVKVMLLTGFPSKIFPGFMSELVRLSDKITVSIHAEKMDIDKCLYGLDASKDIRQMRLSVMKDFLTNTKRKGNNIYDTSVYLMIEDDAEKIEETSKVLHAFLDKYLTSVSDLDYQQRDGFLSALPMGTNKVQYARVFTEDDLRALIPVSKLRDAQNDKSAVSYGTDLIQGDITYSRLLAKENGAILSTDAKWCVEKALEEMKEYKKNVDYYIVLADEDTDTSMFVPDGLKESEQMLDLNDADDFTKQALVGRWAYESIQVNGLTSIRGLNDITKALPFAKGEHYLDDFLSALTDDNVKRSLNTRQCPTKFYYKAYESDNVGVIKATGKNKLERTMAYTIMFNMIPSCMLYSLNSEMMVSKFPQFEIRDEVTYTLLIGESKVPKFLNDGPTGNVDHVYDDVTFKRYIGSSPYLLIGEHKVAEKLKLCNANPLSKEQKSWISEPARGYLLITKEASYMMKN